MINTKISNTSKTILKIVWIFSIVETVIILANEICKIDKQIQSIFFMSVTYKDLNINFNIKVSDGTQYGVKSERHTRTIKA